MTDQNTAAELKHAREQGSLDDAADRLTKDDLANAREDLIDKLVAGKRVYGTCAADIFDDALQVSGHAGYHGVIDLALGLVALERRCGDDAIDLKDKLCKEATAFIERYVDAHQDLILERAQEIDAEHKEE